MTTEKTPPDFKELHNIDAGLNNLTYQGDSLFKSMTSIIEALRTQSRFNQKGFDKSKLTDVILERTGILTEFVVGEEPGIDAMAVPPYVNPNHVLYRDVIRETAAMVWKPGFRKLNGQRSGWVDMKAGKVGGWYSDLTCILYLTEGFDIDSITSEEIASALLHEIGHLYYYFCTVDKSILDVAIVSRTVQEASGIKDPMKRRDVIIYGMKQMDIDIVDPDALAEKYDGKNVADLVTLMYLDAKLKPQEVAVDAEYSQRAWEQLSDHFATMHGAAPELASVLVKAATAAGSKYTQTNGVFFAVEAFKLLGCFLFPIITPFIILYMYFDDDALKYDAMPKRLKLMRQTLIGEIKVHFNNVKMVKKLQEDIALIAELEKSVYDNQTLYDVIQNTIVPRIRRMNKQTRLHTVVEGLIYNDLFTSAVMIK